MASPADADRDSPTPAPAPDGSPAASAPAAGGTEDVSKTAAGGDDGTVEGTSADAADDFTPQPGKTYVWSSTAQVSQTIPWSGWAACGLGDSRYKHVKDYTRPNIDPRMYSNYARLYCGRVDSVPGESTFGYWHIKDAHMNDWQNKANYIGRGWQDFLGWVFSYEFRDPGRVTRSSSTRFCYCPAPVVR